ncbi:SdrD B-like domain-containing protein [[Empedobacter] haloabium]|uniref:SdrD B-like domain-containing protein n=1 Tax=[Empedobacter] haloabium TaxID=592317 RepID=A0ABZ1UR18_9BURK
MSDLSLASTIHVYEDTSVNLALRDILAQAGYTSAQDVTISEFVAILPDGTRVFDNTPLFGTVDEQTLYVRPGAWQPNYNGGFSTYEFLVAGEDGDLVTLTLKIVVDPVNDAPFGADRSYDLADRTPVVLGEDAFGFRDPVEGDAFQSVIITALPLAGQVLLRGAAIAAGTEVTALELRAGVLTFVPSATTGGVVEVGFHVRDNGGTVGPGAQDTSVAENHLTFKVPVPTPPDNPPPTGGEGALAQLGDTIWEDGNGNGIQDAGERGIAGVTVELLDASGAVVKTTTTGNDGQYFFNVAAGSYTAQLRAPSGYVVTAKGQGSDRGADSDFDASGRTDAIKLAQGEVNNAADGGLYRAASLTSQAWLDADRDGVRDAGETAVANVKVVLLDSAGQAVASAVTDANGGYTFANLKPGSYSLKFDSATLPAGLKFTTPGLDSAARDDGSTASVTLASGAHATLAAGLVDEMATIGDRVWEDRNGNGTQDSGETGIGGVTVQLKDATGKIVASTTTDAAGAYSFKAAAGTYSVAVKAPTGYLATTADAGDDATDSDIGANGATAQFTVRGGDKLATIDAGLYRAASLGNKVWYDCDGDGIQDSGEAGIGGARVTLLDGAGKALATTTTDCNGLYQFANLKPGSYSVQFDKSALPSGYVITRRDAGSDDARDSDIGADGRSHQVTLVSGENNTSVDAGVTAAASVGNRVWEDSDFDGVQDAGEAGVCGVTVRLYDAAHNLQASTVTAADGSYKFGNLQAGSYSVEVVKPNGWYTTKANMGSDSLDSDFRDLAGGSAGNTSSSGTFTLAAGEQNTSIDAGLYRKASIGDKVWRDANHNGVQDRGEEGIGKVKVALYNAATGTLVGSTVTDAKGAYLFSNLDPGSYYLKFDKTNVLFTDLSNRTYSMNDWKWGVKNTGSNDAIDSDVNGDGISKVGVSYTDTTFLSSGENDMSWDAAITPIAIDLNGDGIHTIARADFHGSFDLLGTGRAIQSGWLSAGDAFLAIDANGNGSIDGIGELFGGAAKGSGFAKLASFDSNGDGVVDAHDAQFGALALWQDANSNGRTDAGELISLAQAGVTALGATFEELPFLDANGNLHLERSSAVVNGHAADMTDVYFNVAAADAAAAGIAAPNMAQLVGQPELQQPVL